MGIFDRFADRASTSVSRAPFFAFCVLIVVLWLPTLLFWDINTSQLIINTITTIITFLLVALLQNAQERFEKAAHEKLDLLLIGISTILQEHGQGDIAAKVLEATRAEEDVGS